MVAEQRVETVPVTTCNYVSEERVEPYEVQTCKLVAEERVEPYRSQPAATWPRNASSGCPCRPAAWFKRRLHARCPVCVAEQVPVTVNRVVARKFPVPWPCSSAPWCLSSLHLPVLPVSRSDARNGRNGVPGGTPFSLNFRFTGQVNVDTFGSFSSTTQRGESRRSESVWGPGKGSKRRTPDSRLSSPRLGETAMLVFRSSRRRLYDHLIPPRLESRRRQLGGTSVYFPSVPIASTPPLPVTCPPPG